MKRVVVDADMAFAVGDCEGYIRSSANALNVYVDRLKDLRMLRRSAGIIDEMSGTMIEWCEANRLSLRILVNNQIVAEGGSQTDDRALRIRWGRYWRVRPFVVLKLILKR